MFSTPECKLCPMLEACKKTDFIFPCSTSSKILVSEGIHYIYVKLLPDDHFQFALIPRPNIPGSYAIMLFAALDLASITSSIHSWVLFLLWLHPFILSGVISPLISSSILGTLPTWGVPLSVSYHFAFSYCSWGSQDKNTEVVCHSLLLWTNSVRPLHHDPSILGGPIPHGLVS